MIAPVELVDLFVKFVLIVVLAGIVGYERERIHRPAGLRTHIIVGIGSLVFSILSVKLFPDDPARIASGIVTGIGFLGAGTIFREKDVVKGLTTAASLWATAAIGMALAFGEYLLAIVGSLVIYLVLDAKNYPLIRELFWDYHEGVERSREDTQENVTSSAERPSSRVSKTRASSRSVKPSPKSSKNTTTAEAAAKKKAATKKRASVKRKSGKS